MSYQCNVELLLLHRRTEAIVQQIANGQLCTLSVVNHLPLYFHPQQIPKRTPISLTLKKYPSRLPSLPPLKNTPPDPYLSHPQQEPHSTPISPTLNKYHSRPQSVAPANTPPSPNTPPDPFLSHPHQNPSGPLPSRSPEIPSNLPSNLSCGRSERSAFSIPSAAFTVTEGGSLDHQLSQNGSLVFRAYDVMTVKSPHLSGPSDRPRSVGRRRWRRRQERQWRYTYIYHKYMQEIMRNLYPGRSSPGMMACPEG